MKVHVLGALFLLTALAAARQTPVTPIPVEEEPHHHVIFKNEYVLVMHVMLAPGESTQYHTHSHDRVAVDLVASTISRQRLGEPEEAPSTSKPGDFSISTEGDSPYTHRVHNVGQTPFDVLDVEILQRPKQPASAEAALVAGENPSARVYSWILAPGATSATHTHERPYLIIAATAVQLKMTAQDGKSITEQVKPGDVHWVDSKITHSLTNQGTIEGRIVEIEMK